MQLIFKQLQLCANIKGIVCRQMHSPLLVIIVLQDWLDFVFIHRQHVKKSLDFIIVGLIFIIKILT